MDFTKSALALGSAGVQDLIQGVEDLELDDILGVIGLEKRASAIWRLLPAAGLIAFSAAVGAGVRRPGTEFRVVVLVAPSSGSKLRARISDRLDDAKRRLSDTVSHYEINKNHRHAVS
jgi:hypothetical protein